MVWVKEETGGRIVSVLVYENMCTVMYNVKGITEWKDSQPASQPISQPVSQSRGSTILT